MCNIDRGSIPENVEIRVSCWLSGMGARSTLRVVKDDNGRDGNLEKTYYVYILASRKGGTLYIGVTNDIARRSWQHREGIAGGFTKDHEVHRLVYVEQCPDVREAIAREKKLKKWKRQYKIELIESVNPDWSDLYNNLLK